jgi:hypothetical protein
MVALAEPVVMQEMLVRRVPPVQGLAQLALAERVAPMESVATVALVVPDGIQHLLERQVESAVPVALVAIAAKALRASVATVVLAALGLAEQMHS